jgi:U3 small nucleolar RNA-associated protein 10
VENISNGVKNQTLLPTIQNLVQNPLLGGVFGSSLEKYATLVISSFDISSSSELNEKSSPSWPVFISVLRHVFRSGVQIVASLFLIGDANFDV